MSEQPKRILITGGCGYLGSRLLRDLTLTSQDSLEVIRVLDNLSTGDLRAMQHLPTGPTYEFMEADIIDPGTLTLAVQGMDAVIHLAALVRTPLSFENPAWLQQVNHWGTSHLAEACIRAGVPRLIFTSSTAVYGPGGPFDESAFCRPQGSYAETKLAAEQVLENARRRGLRATSLRLSSLYGLAPITRYNSVANRLAYLAGVGRPLTIYGSGEQRRPFLHVEDAAGAVIDALYHAEWADQQALNVVGETLTIQALAHRLSAVKPDITLRYTDQDVRTHYSFDINGRRLRELGWAPRVNIEEGLAEIVKSFSGVTTPKR
ncbi:MAG: NAD-dependent epimerase/dehydratase family protein [Caldilineaceae bacterium]|nr:NAD-dependent epimerase/dehydratase family protein [Caldilineaceae bacterium]